MINLSTEFHPQPKVYKAKKTPKRLGTGKRTKAWEDGRVDIKKYFEKLGITQCEIRMEGCLKDNFLGFAHVERRVNYTEEELIKPDHVVLACRQCHYTVDNEMPKTESKKLLETIVFKRRIP